MVIWSIVAAKFLHLAVPKIFTNYHRIKFTASSFLFCLYEGKGTDVSADCFYSVLFMMNIMSHYQNILIITKRKSVKKDIILMTWENKWSTCKALQKR